MDWQAWGVQAIQALVPVVTVVLVWGAKKGIPKLPRVALPVIAMALGFGVDAFLSYIAGHTFTPVVGALLGASAVWLREIVSTVREHGANP